MKLYGYLKGNGKLGNIVVSQVGGETIARDYQPNVSNPNTQMQVNQRGRFKLMAQIAAALAPVIAIPKKGLVSGRNQFVSRNIGQVYANDNVTSVSVENLQLTAGSSGLPAVVASRTAAAGSISVKLASSAAMACSRVVYCMFVKTSYERLQYVTSIVADDVDGDGLFAAQLPAVGADAVIYAYGIKDLNAAASAAYGNYGVQNGEDVARLILSRSLSMSDYSFTQTRGTTLYGGELGNNSAGDGETSVFVTANGNGTVRGGGIYAQGSNVSLQAVANEGSNFVGWFENGSSRVVSQNPVMTFKAQQIADYVAIFSNPANPYLAPNGQPLVNNLPLNSVKIESGEGEEFFVDGGVMYVTGTLNDQWFVYNVPLDSLIEYECAGGRFTLYYEEELSCFRISLPTSTRYDINWNFGQFYYNGYPWVVVSNHEPADVYTDARISAHSPSLVKEINLPIDGFGVVRVNDTKMDEYLIKGIEEGLEVAMDSGFDFTTENFGEWDESKKAYVVDGAEVGELPAVILVEGHVIARIESTKWTNPFPGARIHLRGVDEAITENPTYLNEADVKEIYFTGVDESVSNMMAVSNGEECPMGWDSEQSGGAWCLHQSYLSRWHPNNNVFFYVRDSNYNWKLFVHVVNVPIE